MEKTEKPTQKKIADSRKKGQVFSSNDMIIAINIITGVLLLLVMLPTFDKTIRTDIEVVIFSISTMSEDANVNYYALCERLLAGMITTTAPFLVALSLMSTAAKLSQVGFILSVEPIMPKLENISPISYVKKLFSKKSVFEFLKSVLKVVLITTVAAYFLVYAILDLIASTNTDLSAVFVVFKKYFLFVIFSCIIPFLFIAGVDYWVQRSAYIKQLMMSMYEIKKEFKENEGDPEFKSKRKSFFMEVMNSNQKRAGTVVNPTHFAVTFTYKAGPDPNPVVIVKGVDGDALAIIAESKMHGVPVFLHPPLARELYHKVKVGSPIDKGLRNAIMFIIDKIDRGIHPNEVNVVYEFDHQHKIG